MRELSQLQSVGQNMDDSYPSPESGKHLQMSEKKVLVRLAVFFLVLFGTHVLLLRLHPFGAHRFFWNLGLGAISCWVVLRLVMSPLKDKSPGIDHNQGPFGA
jgi:hypothetical protein